MEDKVTKLVVYTKHNVEL